MLPHLNEIKMENLCVFLSVINVCAVSVLSQVSQHYQRVFIGNSGNKTESNAAADMQEQRKKGEILSDDAALGADQKAPQTAEKQMLCN